LGLTFRAIADGSYECDDILMGRVAVASWTALLLSTTCLAEQRPDPKYTPNLARPAYVTAEPVVAIDQAHHNLHTLDGRYAPFGKLLAADGYRVGPFVEPFSAESLRGVDVLVIANARSSNPGMSAFGRDEIVAVQDWVNQGGSLLLISDHAPFGTAASHLAEAFKVDTGAGFVVALPREHELADPVSKGRFGTTPDHHRA
jgi:hypothetical protein